MAGEARRVILGVLVALAFLPGPAAAADPALSRATLLIEAGRPAEALLLLHEVEARLPDPREIWPLLGAGYLQVGWQQMNRGEEAAARDAFSRARDYLPDDGRPLRATALSWLHVGQPAAALGPLYEALALDTEDAEALVLLGRAHYALGDLVQAETAWAQATRLGATAAVPLLEKSRRERQAEGGMSKALSGRFLLGYAPEVSEPVAAAVLDVLQEAYLEIGRELGYYPDTDIPVLLYTNRDFAAVTRSPEWAAAVYDGKIRVPLGGVQRMTPPLRALLRHEYAHVLVRFLGKGRVPVWLNEGVAQLVEGGHDDFREPAPGDRTLPAAALDRPFTELPAELVPAAYAQSRARVAQLVAVCGWPALGELLRRLGTGLPWEEAVAEAYAPCGYDWPRLQVELGMATGE